MSVYDEASLWPIWIEAVDHCGYTLWGSGGGEDDRLLAEASGRQALFLFARWSSLVAFVSDGAPCNLSSVAGYPRLHDPSFTWGGAPARMVFEGIRTAWAVQDTLWKIEQNATSGGAEVGDGSEITFMQFEFDSREDLSKFLSGAPARVRYEK